MLLENINKIFENIAKRKISFKTLFSVLEKNNK